MNEIESHPGSEDNPGFLLWQVSTLWSRSTAVALKPFGLTHPQFVILAAIDWLKGKGVSQEEIGRRVVMESKFTAHLLRSLQTKGLIEPSLMLTNAGVEILAKVLAVVGRADAAFFASIDLKNSKMIATLQTLARANFLKNDGEPCTLLDDDEPSCSS